MTDDEFIKAANRTKTFLRGLQLGLELRLPDGYRYAVQDGRLGTVAVRSRAGQPDEDVLLSAEHMTVQYLLNQLAALPDDEFALFSADCVLNQTRRTGERSST